MKIPPPHYEGWRSDSSRCFHAIYSLLDNCNVFRHHITAGDRLYVPPTTATSCVVANNDILLFELVFLRAWLPITSQYSSSMCCVTLRTYLLQASIALHGSAPSAYNARNVRVLIASSKKYLHQKRQEVCSSAAVTKMKPWPLLDQQCYLRRKTRDHCAQPARVTHAFVYFSLPRGKRIPISILAC